MRTTRATIILDPSTEQLENAWWRLMGGALELHTNPEDRVFFQTMLDYVKSASDRGIPLIAAGGEGEPLNLATGEEMAKRLVAAFSALFYGV